MVQVAAKGITMELKQMASLGFGIAGFIIIGVASNWTTAFGVFLLVWSNNLAKMK